MSVNTKSSSTHIRINPEVKAKAMPILNLLHLSLGDYVNMALTSLTFQRGIPFDLKLPPASFTSWEDFEKDVEETHLAIESGTAKPYRSVDEMFAALDAEDDNEYYR